MYSMCYLCFLKFRVKHTLYSGKCFFSYEYTHKLNMTEIKTLSAFPDYPANFLKTLC